MADNEVRLPDPGKLIVSSSPHFADPQTVQTIMLTVILSLVPACLAGIVCFGLRAAGVLVVCCVSCVTVEALAARWLKRPLAVRDGSALLTGLLLGMNLSALTPWWVCGVGSVLAIGLGKMIYGGLGYNPFNPALVGRVALLIAFPSVMTTWVTSTPGRMLGDAVTTATPLGTLGVLHRWVPDQVMACGGQALSYWDLFAGNLAGCIGETSKVALLAGGLFLIWKKLIRWQVPVCFIGTVAVMTGVAHALAPELRAPPLFHVLTGGVILGAFFMATDMVTSPMTGLGGAIFGIGCGVITCVIRLWGGYPEGVSFSILFMNALTPMIDQFTAGRPFGARPRKGGAP